MAIPALDTPETTPAARQPAGAIPVERAVGLPAKLRWSLVGWYRATGALVAAAALLDAVAERDGETIRLIEERARLAVAAGRSDEAVSLLEERAARAPSATAWVQLGRVHLEAGDVDAAAAIADDLMADSAGLQTVAQFAGDVARARGDRTAARAHNEAILEARPDHVGSLLALAAIAVEDGDRRLAAALLDRALDGAEENLTSSQLGAAADVAAEVGRTGQATELRSRASALDAARGAALLAEVHAALGWEPPAASTRFPGAGVAGATAVSPGGSPGTGDGDRRRAAGSGAAGGESDRPAAPSPVADRAAAARPASARRAEEPAPTLGTFAPTPDPDLSETHPAALETLRRDFGFPALRPGQAAVIDNVLVGRDTLATMPTGAGKSLTFQLPAMLLPGATLVISPLIALMKDQVDGLPPAVRARTVLVNSTLSADEQRRALDGVAGGTYKLVYAAPERLRQHGFLRALREAGTSLVVVDEAHCISMWGFDFRPDYLSIPQALPELGQPPVLAITATATPAMADAIGIGLGRDLARVRVSLFRPNLTYEAHLLANREEKLREVVRVCQQERGSGIVYVGSRRDTEQIANTLRDRGVNAVPYHAGLAQDERARNQERFMAGQARVVVATVAFGMGVNKSDVRFIVHLSPPRSLEAYAQESGRAGRDGRPARCVLLYAASDQRQMRMIARRDQLTVPTLRRVYAAVQRQATGRWAIVDPATLLPAPTERDQADEDVDPRVALGILEQAGLLRRHPDTAVSRSVSLFAGPAWDDPGPTSEPMDLGWDDGVGLDVDPGSPWEPSAPAPPAATRAALGDSKPLPEPAPAIPTTPAEPDPRWERFASWSGLTGGRGSVRVRTVEACDALGIGPEALDALLASQPDLVVHDGPRQVCLELLPVGADARGRLERVLADAQVEADRRIAQVMDFADGRACRHQTLAAHLGERMDRCGDACDVCLGTATRGDGAGRLGGTAAAPAQRKWATAEDALAVLEAVRTLPFPMGKTGLSRLLAGSVESRVRADRSSSFGKLADLAKARIDSLIDRLIDDGYLFRDLDHEFKLVTLTERGARADAGDLAEYGAATAPSLGSPSRSTGRGRPAAVPAADDGVVLDPDGEALLARLVAWRGERAAADAVPAYVVATNATLFEVALRRPTSPAALAQVGGFGPKRVEKYGEEILALVAAD